MMHTHIRGLMLLLLIFLITGCVASHVDEGKRQYMMALQSEMPLPHYKAALEELDAALARDSTLFQAYAIKGLIYRQLEDYDRAIENLEMAKQGDFSGQQQWVSIIINLTYGEIFHSRATNAIRSGDWESAKSYQETALQFFNNVITTSFSNIGNQAEGFDMGVSLPELYIKAQERWAAGKFQMAAIAGRTESKERQSELLREVIVRLNAVIETYPEATPLRYYLAEGYRKQALTIRTTDPEESARLQEQAMSQLRACAELGLPADLRNPAAQLVRAISQGVETELELKLMGEWASP